MTDGDRVMLIIAACAAGIGFLSMLYGWLQEKWWKFIDWWHQAPAYNMSSAPADDEKMPVVANNATTQQPATTYCNAGFDHNVLLLQGQAQALATMVKAGKVGETEGIKIVFHVSPSSSNSRYLAARAALKDELAKLEPGPHFLDTDTGGRVPASYPVSGRRT